jgi:hypothetical protein
MQNGAPGGRALPVKSNDRSYLARMDKTGRRSGI